MGNSSPSKFWSSLASVVVPKTPRGRLWQAVTLVLILFVFTANLSAPKYWDAAADKVGEAIGFKVPHFWNVPFRLGLDLQGGTHLVYTADMGAIPEADRTEAMEGVRDVIERRVNAFGVSEPLVQVDRAGDLWRLIVDLAGVSDVSEAIAQIGETPILEFKEPNTEPPRDLTAEERAQMEADNAAVRGRAEQALAAARKSDADFAAIAAEFSEDEGSKVRGGELDTENPTDSYYYDGLVDQLPQSAKDGQLAAGTVIPQVLELSGSAHVVKYLGRTETKEVQARHLLLCFQGADGCAQERTREEARLLVEEIAEQVKGGADLGEIAREKSDDSDSKENGGDLGWFGRGAMVPAFETAAYDLAVGGLSGVIETNYGFHLIEKTGERPGYDYDLAHVMFRLTTPYDIVPPPEEWKNTALSGKNLKRSALEFNQQTNEPLVSLEFNDEGRVLFAEITERNVGRSVAIFLDGEALSIPIVNEAIREGNAVITGSFTILEAKQLARRLNAGALPVPITLETQTSVGASLGQESLDASLWAGLLGFIVVALFMLLYYRLPGLIAVVALVLYAATNLAVFKLVGVTLTLSGIAGFILSVGMAVDANVLIFERLKEELQRGRTIQSAIDEGFRRAWNSIRDSNFTTLLSCAILYYTSSSLIKGFALTLAIGVLISMFSAITASRTFLRLVAGWRVFKGSAWYMPGLNRVPAPGAPSADQSIK
jgi:protein-export SecD/SecF family membrane protein